MLGHARPSRLKVLQLLLLYFDERSRDVGVVVSRPQDLIVQMLMDGALDGFCANQNGGAAQKARSDSKQGATQSPKRKSSTMSDRPLLHKALEFDPVSSLVGQGVIEKRK